jgi:hypothetical protein
MEKLFCLIDYIPKSTEQTAIGAVFLAAGIPSGESILAVAVLSILLTAPLGAIGIIRVGEKVLDHSEHSACRSKALRGKMDLPCIWERVHGKPYGTRLPSEISKTTIEHPPFGRC